MPSAVRTAKFIARKQWIVCGADDMYVRVYNYNTMDKVKAFEAHTDYIRCAGQPWATPLTPPQGYRSRTPCGQQVLLVALLIDLAIGLGCWAVVFGCLGWQLVAL